LLQQASESGERCTILVDALGISGPARPGDAKGINQNSASFSGL